MPSAPSGGTHGVRAGRLAAFDDERRGHEEAHFLRVHAPVYRRAPRRCMTAPTPLTISDWHLAAARARSPRALLLALQRRLEAEPTPGVWITLVDRARNGVADRRARGARRALPGG